MTKTLNNYILAADVGGTNTRMAVVTGEGEILTQSKKPTHCKEGRDKMIKFLVSFSRETIEKAHWCFHSKLFPMNDTDGQSKRQRLILKIFHYDRQIRDHYLPSLL